MIQRDLLTDERRLVEELCAVERLHGGFQSVKKNKGSPGVDGVTIAEFESRLDEELGRLQAELASWTYKPSPVRRVEIPKPGGRGIRKLGVPTADGARPGCPSDPQAPARADLRADLLRQ